MRSVEGFSDKELRRHSGARPRNLRTILYHKAEVPGIQSGGSRLREGEKPQWRLGSLDVKTAFLYAELNEEEDGI
eukprot:4060337-Lingulodinium_polyedra.AAC.1